MMDAVFGKTAVVAAFCLPAAAAAGEEPRRFSDDCSSLALDNRGQAIETLTSLVPLGSLDFVN